MSDAESQSSGPLRRVAGIDYGTVRIGVAVASLEAGIASPLVNYTRRNERLDAEYFRSLVSDERIELLVVGLPVHTDGSESAKSTEARGFGRWLQQVTGIPVEYFDERYTSVEAERLLQQASLTSKQRKARLDKLAAQILLTAWLEAGGRSQPSAGPLHD